MVSSGEEVVAVIIYYILFVNGKNAYYMEAFAVKVYILVFKGAYAIAPLVSAVGYAGYIEGRQGSADSAAAYLEIADASEVDFRSEAVLAAIECHKQGGYKLAVGKSARVAEFAEGIEVVPVKVGVNVGYLLNAVYFTEALA